MQENRVHESFYQFEECDRNFFILASLYEKQLEAICKKICKRYRICRHSSVLVDAYQKLEEATELEPDLNFEAYCHPLRFLRLVFRSFCRDEIKRSGAKLIGQALSLDNESETYLLRLAQSKPLNVTDIIDKLETITQKAYVLMMMEAILDDDLLNADFIGKKIGLSRRRTLAVRKEIIELVNCKGLS